MSTIATRLSRLERAAEQQSDVDDRQRAKADFDWVAFRRLLFVQSVAENRPRLDTPFGDIVAGLVGRKRSLNAACAYLGRQMPSEAELMAEADAEACEIADLDGAAWDRCVAEWYGKGGRPR